MTPEPPFGRSALGRLRRDAGRAGRHLRQWATGGPADYRRLAREYAFRSLRHLTPAVVTEGNDGLRYMVSTADLGIGRTLFAVGEYGAAELGFALELVRRHSDHGARGRAFVDVGANIGTTTLPAVLVHGFERAVAVEASPSNLLLLRANIELNGVSERVQVVAAAAGAEEGSATLEVAPRNHGDSRIRSGPGRDGAFGEGSWSTTSVPVRRLDDILEGAGVEPGDVGLLWIDVQGYEPQVLLGAKSVLAAGVPVVLEYWPYGLGRAGKAADLHTLIAEHYERFVDLGDRARGHAASVGFRPTAEVASLAGRLGPTEHTNLLLLR